MPANPIAPNIRVTMLGGFQLLSGRARVTLPASAERLLAFLALTGGAVRRAFAAGSLWPEVSEAHAFGSLRSAVSRLGHDGRVALQADALDLELAPAVQVDLRDARSLARRLLGPTPPEADLGGDAVAILDRELLPGWYDDWVLVESEAWRQLRLHALEALARHLTAAGRFGEAALAAGSSIRTEPLRETAHATLIGVHLAEGNQSEAIRQFDRLRTILRDELGLEPSPRILALLPQRAP